MNWSNLTKKRQEELKREKENEKKIYFEKFKEDINEYYFEHFSDDYYDLYLFLSKLLAERYICTERKYNYQKFVDFVDKYSNHRRVYVDENIEKYLEEESSEDEDDETNPEEEFLFKQKGF